MLCRLAASSHEDLQQALLDLNRSPTVARPTSVVVLSVVVPPRTLPLLAGRPRTAPRRAPTATRPHLREVSGHDGNRGHRSERGPERARLRGVRRGRRLVGAPAPVRRVRSRGLLRQLAGPSTRRPTSAKTGHPIVQSFEPGEEWFWDYRTDEAGRGPELAPPTHRPLDQTVPGPAERVPADWQSKIH